ncbi:MAG TPA: rhodanese-like domain-containing protein [Sulfuricella sp.]|nr:rhodanese-like domain-containing protein [Sulfuricella sp.]
MFGINEIDVHGLHSLLSEKKKFALVDVRGDNEVAYGVIEGAQHLPLHLLPIKADELDKNTHTVFYCRSGARSAQACAFMAARGHDNVYNLQGGIMAWMQSGLSLAKVA